METRLFNRQQLNDYINSDHYNRLTRIPISRHRAISQINNPRADEKDILLVTMVEDEDLVGYLGVLPDLIFHQNQWSRVGWLSCFWVDEAYRSESIAGTLFLHIMEAWENRILITNFVPSLASLYRRTGMFLPERIKTGIRAYMRLNLSEVLPPKARWLSTIKPFLSISDGLFNLVADFRFFFFRRQISRFYYQFLDEPDVNTANYISLNIGNSLPQRSLTDLEWIIKYPWIHEQSTDDGYAGRYYFSSVSKRFFYKLIVWLNDEKALIGAAMILVRNNHLTVPYIFSGETDFETLAQILTDYMVEMKLNMITIYDPRLIKAIRNRKMVFLYQKEILKPYFISKQLSFINNLNFQDGDGDCVFY
jgi:hypothetical protein